jgi:fucose 4-O-acetylase-like acetyltransferase
MMMNRRNEAFDAMKGMLIILVILGHVLLGSISENPVREMIYFFHMPLFLAITGYFTKKSLVAKPSLEIIRKYMHRMIVPFVLAFIFYTAITLLKDYLSGSVQLQDILARILYPYYHLWYIPAVILFVFYTKAVDSMPVRVSGFFLIVFTFVTFFFEGGQYISDSVAYKLLGDKRFYYYFIYFYAGYYMSTRMPDVNEYLVYFLLVVGFLFYGYSSNELLNGVGKCIANLCMIALLLPALQRISCGIRFLTEIGKVSLPIYLWHVLPLIVLKRLPLPENEYYLLSTLVLLLFVYVIMKFKGRSVLMDKYVYGIVR